MTQPKYQDRLVLVLKKVQARWLARDVIQLGILVASWVFISMLLYAAFSRAHHVTFLTVAILLGIALCLYIYKSKLFTGIYEPEAALYLDERLTSKERVISAVELIQTAGINDSRLAILSTQLDGLIGDNQDSLLPPITISRHIIVIGVFGIISLIIYLFISVSQLHESSQSSLIKIEELLLKEQELPPEVKEVILDLKETLESNNLTSDEVTEALQKAQSEIENAQKELDTMSGKTSESEFQAIPPTATPTPTPKPSQEEEKQKDADVQNSESTKQEGEKKEDQKSEEKDEGKQAKEQDSKKSQDAKSKNDKGSDSSDKQGESKGGENQKESNKDGQSQQQDSQSKDGKGDSKGQEPKEGSKGEQGEDKKDQKGEGQKEGDKQNDNNGAGEQKQNEESKALKAASQTMNAIKQEQKEQKNEGDPKDGKDGDSKQDSSKKPDSKDAQGSKGKGEDSKSGDNEGKSDSKKSEPAKKKQDERSDPAANEKPRGGSGSDGQSDAKEFVPGKGDIKSPYGENKKLEETQIGRKDEKFDTQYTSKEGQIAKNPHEAQPKTKLSDVTVARPEIQKEKSEQPIPLEYRDVLE